MSDFYQRSLIEVSRSHASSVTAVEEESDTADDVAVRRTVAGHLDRAEKLLSVQVEVERSLNDLLLRVWIRLVILDPSQIGDWKLDNLRSLASNLVHLDTIEGTTLQE